MRLSFSARARAASSTSPPRAVFTRKAPGRIWVRNVKLSSKLNVLDWFLTCLMVYSLIRWWLCSLRVQWRETQSDLKSKSWEVRHLILGNCLNKSQGGADKIATRFGKSWQGCTVHLQGVDSLQTQALLDAVWQVGIVEDHVEPKGLRSQSHCWSDSPCKTNVDTSLSWHFYNIQIKGVQTIVSAYLMLQLCQ